MEAILDMTMEDILERIALSKKIKDALLGKNRMFNQLNDLITSFEQGQWDHARFQADKNSKLIQKLPTFYMDALKMADSFLTSA
jgi:EAL and modified HD-GYP domain-containing signal transduction protein